MSSDKQSWQARVKDHLFSGDQPLLAVVGPTASGKTAFSVSLAKWIFSEFGKEAEIINADSRQLYEGMDIGTAKVREQEMDGVAHHLINVLRPEEETSAGWFQAEAKRIIKKIHSRNAVPILVGGSMLYVSSIIDDLTLGPTADPELRSELLTQYELDGGQTLYKKLREVDPQSAERIDPKNAPRLIRALEICLLKETTKAQAVPQSELRSSRKNSEYSLLIFGLGKDRDVTVEKINNRTNMLFAQGWVKEVQKLLSSGVRKDDPGMKACGYREIADFLEQGEDDITNLKEVIAAKTRQYARRQMTWWKTDERIVWI